MKIVADMHTHSIASTHAYGTVKEMAAQAAEIGLYAIGITDHGPAMPGSPRTWYFDNFAAIPKTYMGVRVLMGAEANITDDEGHIDIEESVCRKIEWIVASVHHLTIDENKREYITNNYDACTQLYLNIADNHLCQLVLRTVGHHQLFVKFVLELLHFGELLLKNFSYCFVDVRRISWGFEIVKLVVCRCHSFFFYDDKTFVFLLIFNNATNNRVHRFRALDCNLRVWKKNFFNWIIQMLADGINLLQGVFVGILWVFDIAHLPARDTQNLTQLCLTYSFICAKLLYPLYNLVLVFNVFCHFLFSLSF